MSLSDNLPIGRSARTSESAVIFQYVLGLLAVAFVRLRQQGPLIKVPVNRRCAWLDLEQDLAQTRKPLSWNTFSREVLPPLLCYYATAVLVLAPHTFPIRLALLPISLWGAFRVSTHIDLVAGYADHDRLIYLNQGLVLVTTVLSIRACVWTFKQHPYRRHKPHSSKYIDALDLCCNLRGIGWSWSHGLKIPIETRNTSSLSSFLLSTCVSFLIHFFLFDLFHFAVQAFGPDSIGSAAGGSIYDTSLPPVYMYLRCFSISFLLAPLFDQPWYATSVVNFWARWHQLFRDIFIESGGRPVGYLTGRTGGFLGTFFVSGIMHYLGLWGMGRGSDFLAVVGYFMMMGVGVVLEFKFKAVTGHRMKGAFGWAWANLWISSWGIMLIEAWCIRGLVGSKFFPDGWRPAVVILEGLQRWLNIKIV
ncbi:hypothetical protein BDZ97DRAFT_1905135 [Flammula alnicola]|nr:hypothetical protein BDZ97DRAFT_1905135 [Flammula alnicola]